MRTSIVKKIAAMHKVFTLKCVHEATRDPKICAELDKEIQSWDERLKKLSRNIIIEKKEIEGSEEEGMDADPIIDDFVSRLSATISNGIRQIIVPGSPLYPVPYTTKIVYDFYLIKTHNVCTLHF